MADELVIRWTPDQWAVAQVHVSGSRFTLSKTGIKSWDEGTPPRSVSDIAQELRSWLDELQIGEGPVTILVPREYAVLRKLDLPNAPDDELPDLVRFQAATKASTPIDDLALDFLPLPVVEGQPGRGAISVSMDRQRLNRIEAILRAARLSPQHATLTGISLARFVQTTHLHGHAFASPALLLHQQEARIDLAVLDHGNLIYSHGLKLPEGQGAKHVQPLKAELNRLSVALSQMHLNGEISHCYLVASGEPDPDVQEFVKEQYLDRLTILDDATIPETVRGFEALAGAAVRDSRTVAGVDLLHPRKKIEKPDRRKLYWGVGAGIAALLIGAGFLMFRSKVSAYEQTIADLSAELGSLKAEVDKGAPRLEYHKAISNWQSGRADMQQVLKQFVEQLPGTSRLYFRELKIDALAGESVAKITGKMSSRSEEDIRSFLQQLSNNGHRPGTPAIENKGTDPDYPYESDLTVEIVRPKPAEVKKTASGNTTPSPEGKPS